MHEPFAARPTIAVLLAIAYSLSACSGGREGGETPGTSPPPAVERVATHPPLPAVKDEAAPPEGVLRVYVWDCDGGLKLRMKNLYREDAITLEMHEGPRKLTHVIAASGAKYSDGSLTFWTKGGTALLERSDSAPVNCRELRRESIDADARERGVRIRGMGNEPGWLVEIGPGSRLHYAGDHGEDRRDFDDVTERSGGQAGEQVFAAGNPPDGIAVTVTPVPCADDMSGEAFDHRMELEFGGQRYRGCATAIQ